MKSEDEIIRALDDIIDGKIVNRSMHRLVYDGRDVSQSFIERLIQRNYLPMRVEEISVNSGERVPAFVVRDVVAYFGWVFVEKFSDKKSRKLFGSVVKNKKGDWLIQIPTNSKEIVYANLDDKVEIENEKLFVMH
ncbi:MAG: hypothetical protein ACP5US_07110 [Candidatus Kryptoniota bacterium]